MFKKLDVNSIFATDLIHQLDTNITRNLYTLFSNNIDV